MNEFLPLLREILKECLSVAPLKGARLKPLVVREFERRTRVDFAQAFWSVPKFAELLKLNEDLVEIDASGSGDILVRLRQQRTIPTNGRVHSEYLGAQPYVHPGLWHAFTNPDQRRRRFYHRDTGDVVHYIDGDAFSEKLAVRVSADPNYIEVRPVHSAEHSAWMKEYINSNPLPDATRKSLESIVEAPYSSQLNRMFTFALEGHAEGWRRFRTTKMLERVRAWAEQNRIALPELIRAPAERGTKPSTEELAVPAPAPAAVVANLESRKVLHAIVDALDETELARVLIPATAFLKIARALDE